MRPLPPRWALASGAALAAVFLVPEAVAQAPPGALDQVVEDYRTTAESARPLLLGIAKGTFGILAVIEIALAGLWWTLRERGPAEVLSALVVKLGWLGFVGALLVSFDFWFPPIIEGFVQAGGSTLGVALPSPSVLFSEGMTQAAALREGFLDETEFLELFTPGVLDNLFVVLAVSVILELTYIVIAAVVVLTFVEAYVVLATGSLVLGFAAFRGTASLADRFVAYAFAVGIRLFLIYFLVGVGQTLASGWTLAMEANPGDVTTGYAVLAGSLAFALVVVVLPTRVSNYLTSDFAPGFVRGLLSVG